MKRVQIEPHLSVTGAQAQEWIPIKPKSDAAFLFAMIHVLVQEHPLDELDAVFLKRRTAAPYLMGPNGFYLRDGDTGKPLIWDTKSSSAVTYDTVNCEPALTGTYRVDAIEVGADQQSWNHTAVEGAPAHVRIPTQVDRPFRLILTGYSDGR